MKAVPSPTSTATASPTSSPGHTGTRHLISFPDRFRDIPQVTLGFGSRDFYANNGDHIYDVNGDGREDILCGVGWYEHPTGDPFAKPWRFHPETALPTASSPFLVVDVDGDARNDLVWGRGHDYGVYWWEQKEPKPDGTTTWKQHLIDQSWSQAHSMAWADLDGDGKGELITGKRVRGHGGRDPGADEPACLFYYAWDSATEKFIRHTISPPGAGVGTGMQICVADLNSDNRPDIAVAGKTGTWLLINDGAALTRGSR